MTSAKELWYVTRGSGAVALVLLTASVALGIVMSLRVSSARWPRFAVGTLHRNVTLLSVVFIALHVVTTVADGYAPIGIKDSVVPFASPYRPVWLGLGTVSFDLLLALVITSYLRQRIGIRLWRSIHWLAYVSWPVALVHSLGTGSDARTVWLAALGLVCVACVVLAVLVRVAAGAGPAAVRAGSAIVALVAAAAVGVWWHSGPDASGWAKRAGTPARLIASNHVVTRTVLASNRRVTRPPQSFHSALAGTIRQVRGSDGLDRVVMRFRLAGGPGGRLRIDLRGTPVSGGVSMTASGVSFVPATTRAVYLGTVTGLEGSIVAATVRDHAGDRLHLTARLSLDTTTGRASGDLVAARAGTGR